MAPECEEYVRHDSTLTYFFTREELVGLFEAAGFRCLDAGYIEKDVVNRGQGVAMARRWLQAKFVLRPVGENDSASCLD